VRLGKVSIAVKTFGVCDFSHLAVTALALVVFGAYDSYPKNAALIFAGGHITIQGILVAWV